MSNPYRHGLAEGEQMITNDKDQHNCGEKETGLPRYAVAKKTCGELQKRRVGDETHCNENDPWDNHTQDWDLLLGGIGCQRAVLDFWSRKGIEDFTMDPV